MKIASFNVRRLGLSKLSDENIVNYLIKVTTVKSLLRVFYIFTRCGY